MDPAASRGYSGRDCDTGKNLALYIVVQGVSLVSPDPYGSSCISGYSGRDCDTGKNLALSIVVQGVSLVYQIPMDPAEYPEMQLDP